MKIHVWAINEAASRSDYMGMIQIACNHFNISVPHSIYPAACDLLSWTCVCIYIDGIKYTCWSDGTSYTRQLFSYEHYILEGSEAFAQVS